MTITTKQTFQRIHSNGSILVEVPANTELNVEVLYRSGAWKVTASEPIGRYGETSFCVNASEYKQLVGV
jgi:hypothetical protein